jgi:hypothetical protein
MDQESIEFAVAARMRDGLTEACKSVPADKWARLDTRADTVVDVAVADYVPRSLKKLTNVRYLAIRMTPLQTDLVDDDERTTKFLAIATNRTGTPQDLARWFWEKAGTIEHVHDVVKNELGAGVLPCGRFGANAAWVKIAVLAFNLLRVIRMTGPEELRDARPKRLRLHLFAIPAVLVSHARKLYARLNETLRHARSVLVLREDIWRPSIV